MPFIAFFAALILLPLRDLETAASAVLDANTQREMALRLEASADWEKALQAWERILDRCEAAPKWREEAIRHIKPLRERVPQANTDPDLSRTWRAVFLIFEELDYVAGKGLPGEKRYRTRFSSQEVAKVENSIAKFCDQVFRSSSGIVRIVPEIVRVKKPLTDLAGDARGGFWLDPPRALSFVPAQAQIDPYESVFTYVKMKDEKGAQIPVPFWGGTYGGDAGIHGAGYTNICWNPDGESDGELEFHEWMHQVDWMFAAVLGYPDEFVPNPDSGKRRGEAGGDPCYRRAPEEKNWLGFYRHIAEEHVTRLMWGEAGMFEAPTFPIRPNDIAAYLVVGPFTKALEVLPRAGEEVLGKKWTSLKIENRVLDLGRALGAEPGSIAYAFVRVKSPAARDAMLLLGSDDGVRVWVNEKLVHSIDLPRVLQIDLDRVRVSLKEGWNDILFQIENKGGGWLLQSRFVDSEGVALRDLQYE